MPAPTTTLVVTEGELWTLLQALNLLLAQPSPDVFIGDLQLKERLEVELALIRKFNPIPTTEEPPGA